MEPIYNTIGTSYNSTRQADPYITARLLNFLDHHPAKRYLDIGCGTGNYTIALANKGLNFTGLEPSEQMLIEAQSQNKDIKWLKGTAEQIPADDRTIDGGIATLTIHHWSNLNAALKEIGRVTCDDGKIIFFTATPEQMAGYWLTHYFPQMMQAAIMQMPSFKKINDALSDAGFTITAIEKYNVADDLKDGFMYAGKHNPAWYLNDAVRQGISSFASLANINEVETGLALLGADIESGKFTDVKKQYDNELGDYLFIVAGKSFIG